MTLYKEHILDHSKRPRNFRTIKSPDNKADVRNVVCGDEITLMFNVLKGKITDVAFSGHGCAISIASCSLFTEFMKGKSIKDLKKLDESVILELLHIELSPSRMKCAILPLEALHDALK